ncbi:MAG TPA: S8 family serine peptidase, partial [Solirubrobacterales bacterium]|nr:S8 family serine peptidase [Solirubrobacterales bacterium]
EFAPGELVVKLAGERRGHAVELPAGVGVRAAAKALRDNPRVDYATPNFVATASAVSGPTYLVPNDPGGLVETPNASAGAASGGWESVQWNFLPYEGLPGVPIAVSPGGINAPGAWRNLQRAGRPGARHVTVAVIDSGIAYVGQRRKFLPSPDFSPKQFVPGYDFVDGDRVPLDENGHGTHITGTIGERTDNGIGLTGLAYNARLMPIRVLDRRGEGESTGIAKGIRFAVRHGADVINMSFNFGCGRRIPVVDEALREAYERGVITVASVGNLHSESCVAPPATGPHVIGVGGTTEGGCLGDYSLEGAGVDLVAPGGGTPLAGCASVATGPIYQVTLKARSTNRFGIPGNYVGTSMAAAHVSGVAAMVLASGVIDPPRQPRHLVKAVTERLRVTSRDLGLPRTQQGAGLIDAAAATTAGP